MPSSPQLDRSIPGSNVPFTPHEQAVRSILVVCALGARYAVPIARIAERTGMTERDVKFAVQGLRLRHGYQVGSIRKPPGGYFIIECAAELDDTIQPYRQQAFTELRVVRALLGPSERRWREFMGQLQLDLEKKDTAA